MARRGGWAGAAAGSVQLRRKNQPTGEPR